MLSPAAFSSPASDRGPTRGAGLGEPPTRAWRGGAVCLWRSGAGSERPPGRLQPRLPRSALVAEDLRLHHVVPLGLRVAVRPSGKRVLLLRREHQAMTE